MDLNATALSRRSFLKASGATTMVLAAGAIINPLEAWGLEVKTLKPETMRTLIQMARDIYPHDRVGDRFYAMAIKSYDVTEQKDMVAEGIVALDEAAKKAGFDNYLAAGWEDDRVAILRSIQDTPFFQTVRGGLVTGLYNQKDIWPIFGYEGESFSQGGYIDRGFDDIDWL